MKKIIATLSLSLLVSMSISAQNSLLGNSDFEAVYWPEITWVEQTNVGSPIISDQTDTYFEKANIIAKSGLHFAFFGGIQNNAGIYEGELGQMFNLPVSGNVYLTYLTFYLRVYRASVDPSNLIYIELDGEKIWDVNTYYLVDIEDKYVAVNVPVGFLEAGQHSFAVKGYEYTNGGDLPMQVAMDDFILSNTPNASIDNSFSGNFNITMTNGMMQIHSSESINEEVIIELVDLNGKVVQATTVFFQNDYNLVMNALQSGMYIVSLRSSHVNFSHKVFINS